MLSDCKDTDFHRHFQIFIRKLHKRDGSFCVILLFDVADDALADTCQTGDLADACAIFSHSFDDVVSGGLGVVLDVDNVGDTTCRQQELANFFVADPDGGLVVKVENLQGFR